MYGSNYYGKAYFGQGPAEGTTFVLHTVLGTVTVLADISFKLLINHALTASVTATATISRQLQRAIATSVTVAADITTEIVFGLIIKNAYTKMLTLASSTRGIAGFRNTSKLLNLLYKTKRIRESS